MIGKKSLVKVLGAAVTVALILGGTVASYASGGQKPTAQQVQDLTQGGGPLGHGFIENAGQWNSKARYYSSAGDTRMWVTNSSIVYDFFQLTQVKSNKLRAAYNGHVVSMEFKNSSANSTATGTSQVNRTINFIDKNGTHKARSFSEADIKGLYDGVDLHLTKENNNPRFDLIVAPGHSVSNILVNYRGANGVSQNKDGTLSLGTSIGQRQVAQLRAFQSVNGVQSPVDVKFDLKSDGLVGFKVGSYDKARALTIDPVIYSTVMGDDGFYFTQGFGVAVGQDSAPVMTGFSVAPDFPRTVGAYSNYVFGADMFVTKFSQDGTHLMFSTLIGTFSDGVACGTLAQIDSQNRVIIGGFAEGLFPTTAGAIQTEPSAGNDFATTLSILSPDGSHLVYSTYYGGGFVLAGADKFEQGSGATGFGDVQNIGDDPRFYGNLLNLQLDSNDRIYLIGEGTITPTANAYQSTAPQDSTFVACFNRNGTISFATYYGGPNSTTTGGAIGPDGGIYLCGATFGGIPATQGAFQTVCQNEDGFVTKLTPVSATTKKMTVAFTTYLGGSGDDSCDGIAVNSIGEPYVWGDSGSINFPITTGAYGTGSGGGPFAAKFDGAGASLEYATYDGLFANFVTWGAVDPSGNLYLTGSINKDIFQAIPVVNADQGSYTAYNPKEPFAASLGVHPSVTPGDAYLEVINPTGTNLVYSGYWGGTYDDQAEELAIDAGGNCYMAGWTDSFFSTSPGSAEFPTGGQDGVFDNTYSRSPVLEMAPYLFWHWDGAPFPMGFLTKFRVTDALYLTGLSVPGVIAGGTSSSGAVVISGPPSPGNEIPVEIESSNQNLIPPLTVIVPANATSMGFPFKVNDVTVETAITLTAYHDGIYVVRGIQVVPLLQSFSVAVPSIVGGNSTTARVFLSETVPTGATVTVTITSTDPAKAKPVSSTLVIAGGENNGLFTIDTVGVDGPTQVTFSAQVTANTLPNSLQQSFAYTAYSVLTIEPATVTNVQFNPQILLGGNSSNGIVVLNGNAGPTPITIDLTETSGTAPVTLVPTTLVIPAGQNSAKFTAQTKGVFGDAFRTVTATQVLTGATASGTLFVNPVALGALQLFAPTITGGSTAKAYVTLNAPAPPGGVTIGIVSSNPALASLASNTVVIPVRSSQSPTILIKTPVTSTIETVTITATDGPLSVSNTLTVEPEALTLTATSASVEGGLSNFNFVLALARAEQNSNITVTLSSNGGSALTIPASETFTAGATTLDFKGFTNVVPSNLSVTVTATIPSVQGKITATKVVTIQPLPLVVNVLPQNIIGGVQNGQGTVILNVPAAAATVVTLTSNNITAANAVPSTITIPKGSQSATFSVVTNAVAQETPVILTGSDSKGSNSAGFTVLPPNVTLNKLQIAQVSVLGGGSTTGTLFFTGAIPRSGLPVSLKSNNTAAQVGASVTLKTGTTSISFPITTSGVSSDTPVTISAGYGTTLVSAQMTVVAARIGALSLNPSSVVGGNSVTLTISINDAAPPGGISVQLSQSSAILSQPLPNGIAMNGQVIPTIPASGPPPSFPTVTIPAGQTKVTVTLTTPAVSRQLGTTITGFFVGQNTRAGATLLVNPAQ